MKKLSQIELFLDSTYSDEQRKDFIFKSRCACNYLERHLQISSFESEITRINIKCSQNKDEQNIKRLKGTSFLEVVIYYVVPNIGELSSEELQEHFIRIINTGLLATNEFIPTPYDFCSQILNDFRQGGYENRWVHLDKEWKNHSCRVIIEANLTLDAFTLYEKIYLNGQLDEMLEVVRLKTREPLFLPYLGDAKLIKGHLIYSGKGTEITKYNLSRKEFI